MSSEKNKKAVKAIWDRIAKTKPDGKKFIHFPHRDDLVYLFCTGFVDESKYTVLEWVDSFKNSLQPDGSYILSEDQWMEKSKYRYSGPVGQPFNPMFLREGDWTEQDMENLIKTHLAPAVYFSENEFRAIFNEAKESFYFDGVYKLTRDVKEDLKTMIDSYPSPAQVRAFGLAEARSQAGMGGKNPVGSQYASGPAQSQIAAQKLADLLGNLSGKK